MTSAPEATITRPDPAKGSTGQKNGLSVDWARTFDVESAKASVRLKIREEKRRAILERSQRNASLSAPIRDPAFVEEIAKHSSAAAMARAEAESLRIIGPKLHRKRIKMLEAQAASHEAKAEDARKAELDADRLYGEARDPIIMAKLRGEEIDARDVEMAEFVRDDHGARVIHRRGPSKGLPVLKYTAGTRVKVLTGLEHAKANGHLRSEALYQSGIEYGQAYEVSIGQTTNRPEEGGGGSYGPKGPQLRIIEAGDYLKIVRAGLSDRQVAVLDAVCGRHMRLRETAEAMRAGFPATVRALRGGLAIVRENWAEAITGGRAGSVTWDLMIRTQRMGL